jgi:hypothetical protein
MVFEGLIKSICVYIDMMSNLIYFIILWLECAFVYLFLFPFISVQLISWVRYNVVQTLLTRQTKP